MHYFLLFLAFFYHNYAYNQCNQSFIVQETEHMVMIIPKCPIGIGSVQIHPRIEQKKFIHWTIPEQLEGYQLIQKIAQLWHQKGISDYMVYGRETIDSPGFHWEIVPFAPTKTDKARYLKQIKTLWNLTFSPLALSEKKHEQAFNLLINELNSSLNHPPLPSSDLERGKDIFCNIDAISDQIIYEGNFINLLYDYSPISELHFLIVTKAHHSRFDEPSNDEYLEAAILTQNLIKYYQSKGFKTVNTFVKTGKEAGQSQPHWHQHVVFTFNRQTELLVGFQILKKLFFGNAPLDKKKMRERIALIKDELESNQVIVNHGN